MITLFRFVDAAACCKRLCTAVRPSVRPSVCLSVPSTDSSKQQRRAAAGLLQPGARAAELQMQISIDTSAGARAQQRAASVM